LHQRLEAVAARHDLTVVERHRPARRVELGGIHRLAFDVNEPDGRYGLEPVVQALASPTTTMVSASRLNTRWAAARAGALTAVSRSR